jgi:cobalt-precorrin-6B (C15)-methyltransferase
MTKSEVRAVTLSKLRLDRDAKVLDIGAGSGSITVEAALSAPDGHVWGIERHTEAFEVFQENIKRFDIHNITPILGFAPDDLPEETYNAVIIGGSGGQMQDIIKYAYDHMALGGRLVVNIITIENLGKATEAIKAMNFREFEVVQMQVSRGRPVGTVTLMEAMNPIYILSATK